MIIVHTIGYDVAYMLKLAKEVLQKTFTVNVLKQDLANTRRLVKSLSTAGIDMEIIPEYSLSHTIGQGNKAAIAACIQSSRGQPFKVPIH